MQAQTMLLKALLDNTMSFSEEALQFMSTYMLYVDYDVQHITDRTDNLNTEFEQAC